MQYTKFGEEFRILRIKHHEVLSDAAKFLSVSSSFVSAVETGKKNVPDKWLDMICCHYSLNEEQRKKLSQAIEESKTTVKIDMVTATEAQRNVALQFQRSFDDLDEQTAAEIMKILKRNN
jgi:transcriptional regulator with XRE-family HTH domain